MLFLRTYTKLVLEVFSLRMLSLHAFAVLATTVLVFSGVDWAYLVWALSFMPQWLLFSSDVLGFLLPLFLPLTLFLVSRRRKDFFLRTLSIALWYAVLLGYTLSTLLKAFTGRTSPPHHHPGREFILFDNSHAFHFGFMNEQILGGWPSSHATIACAMAVVIVLLLPKRYALHVCAIITALFIGLGVTFGYHWFSEFVAGSLLGTAIGIVVARQYKSAISLS